MKKILVITTRFPVPPQGACPQDRLEGILTLVRLGFEVYVIARVSPYQNEEFFRSFAESKGFKLSLVPYESQKKRSLFKKAAFHLKRFLFPVYLDGAAYEFSHDAIQNEVKRVCAQWHPDIAWCDYTYTWPVQMLVKKSGIPVITRAINFEPHHFLEEKGYTLINYIKAAAKLLGELRTVYCSSVIFSINPMEERTYKRLGAKKVYNLPLRGLPKMLRESHHVRKNAPLHVVFLGSTYTVSHNLKTLIFICRDIVPKVNELYPNKFIFHVLGKKAPKNLLNSSPKNIVFEGHVEDLDSAMDNMDIALVPSLFGAGMQQKIFEPLGRGIPTISSARGLVGYPFVNDEHILLAEHAKDFVDQIGRLLDPELRARLSSSSIKVSSEMFSQDNVDAIISSGIANVL